MPGLGVGCALMRSTMVKGKGGILARPIAMALELLADLLHEEPGKFCQDCIPYG